MSVVEPERHKGRLEVHVKARALAAYTALILSNPKVFDPEVDDELSMLAGMRQQRRRIQDAAQHGQVLSGAMEGR